MESRPIFERNVETYPEEDSGVAEIAPDIVCTLYRAVDGLIS